MSGPAAPRRWLVLALAALAGVALLALFPLRAYLDQNRLRADLATQVSEVDAANAALAARIEELGTDAEIERLARERYQLVRPGEEAYAIVPDGWDPPALPPPPPDPAEQPPEDESWWSRAWDRVAALL